MLNIPRPLGYENNYPSTPNFDHSNEEDKSTIDYLLQGERNMCFLHNIIVLNQDEEITPTNTSDHEPVVAVLGIFYRQHSISRKRPKRQTRVK